jgi:peptidylprolyl isomerase
MKSTALVLILAAGLAGYAQTAPKPAAPAAKSDATAKPAAAGAAAVKYPPGKTASAAVKQTLFALKVQDLKVGTGAEAVPMKMYTVKYTVWRATDGVVFDSWEKHPKPVMDKDGKPVMGEDGKPKMNAPEPAKMAIGFRRMMPGLDQGFWGMRVGGVRRIYVPWQLGFGDQAMPDRTDGPGIPAKSDIVVEVELIDMTDPPAPPTPKIPQGIPPGVPGGPAVQPRPSAPPAGTPPSGGTTSVPPPASAEPTQPAQPSQPSTTPQPQ